MTKRDDLKAAKELGRFYRRRSALRWPDFYRRATENQDYKKGYEIRLIADSPEELGRIQRLMIGLGFKPGAAFVKRTQFVQPLYGREPVVRFLTLVREKIPPIPPKKPRGAPRSKAAPED